MRRFDFISIHALREEGDTECICRIHQMHQYFYPRPPRGGRPQDEQYRIDHRADFYPRPPRGGRLPSLCHSQKPFCDFYPRPPRGGRQGNTAALSVTTIFLSTPSARRATTMCSSSSVTAVNFYPRPPRGGRRSRDGHRADDRGHFYPRPPRGGRLCGVQRALKNRVISIHALREEGDRRSTRSSRAVQNFYPRPPRGGRPGRARCRAATA